MTSSQLLVDRARPVRVASERLMSGHAALMLGVTSTLIYLVSAMIAFFASYTQGSGREKLTLMLLGLLLPLALTAIVRRRFETVLGMLGAVLAVLCPLIGLAALFAPAINRDAAIGTLALLVPLGGCGIVWALSLRNRPLLWVLGACLLVASICVLVSDEHSAILGLTLGLVFGWGLFWRFRLAEPSPWLRVLDISTLTLVSLSVLVYLALILIPDRTGQLSGMLPAYYAQRFASWRDTPALIQDYLYTGSGLGASAMVLSTYLFLVHVPYYHHIHNLFLQVGIEQGLPGVIGLVGMFVAASWSTIIAMRRARVYLALCATAVFAALLALFTSGLFESDVYAGNWIVGMFLPFGFAWLVAQRDVAARTHRGRIANHVRGSDIAVGLLPVIAVLVLIVWPGSDARWLANRAALEQTRIELGHFRFPFNKIQDELRRDGSIDLQPAIRLYQAALERDPNNVTALRRLAQIELSEGKIAGAQQKLEMAYQLAPGQRATRQMLGEVYAVEGDIDRAAALWRTVDNQANQLVARLWWYKYIQDAGAVQHITTVLKRLNIPAS